MIYVADSERYEAVTYSRAGQVQLALRPARRPATRTVVAAARP